MGATDVAKWSQMMPLDGHGRKRSISINGRTGGMNWWMDLRPNKQIKINLQKHFLSLNLLVLAVLPAASMNFIHNMYVIRYKRSACSQMICGQWVWNDVVTRHTHSYYNPANATALKRRVAKSLIAMETRRESARTAVRSSMYVITCKAYWTLKPLTSIFKSV
jgi:hypothetical protein